jgi:hypothetical protein
MSAREIQRSLTPFKGPKDQNSSNNSREPNTWSTALAESLGVSKRAVLPPWPVAGDCTGLMTEGLERTVPSAAGLAGS